MRFLFASLCIVLLLAVSAVAQNPQTPTSIPRTGSTPPWAQAAPEGPKLPVQELAGPRQLLELFNIDASQLDRFFDGRPLHPDEYEPLYRILYRIPRFQKHDLLRWRDPELDWEELAAQPAEYRAASIRLAGRVTRIEKEEVIPEAAELLQYEHFYRVWLEPDEAPYPALVLARWLPRAWEEGENLDYRGGAEGLFLKLGETEEGRPRIVMACERMFWRPVRVQPELGVTEDRVLLASRGVDIGQFDLVRDRRSITGLERDAFYQVLHAAKHIELSTLRQRAASDADLAPLLQSPREMRGEVVALTGEARRVQEIRVEAKDIQERFGIDHYYEIDIFLPLEQHTIKMGESESSPVFTNYFPVIFCVAELPEGMSPDDIVDRQVRIPAFYFKLWSYETEFMKRYGDRQTQLSPMLIGRAPLVLPEAARPLGIFGIIAAALFVAVLAFAWLWLWRTGRRDTAHQRHLRRRRLGADEQNQNQKSLNDIPAQDKPDFGNLP
ncbi:MAG: hypothetical protein KY475_04135 [Planctomycetes bacterium]|nr:hypothetical protein [Planctomycetota bacterium]